MRLPLLYLSDAPWSDSEGCRSMLALLQPLVWRRKYPVVHSTPRMSQPELAFPPLIITTEPTISSDTLNGYLVPNHSVPMEAQALLKEYMNLMEQRRLVRIAEGEESKTIHEAEQNKNDKEINNAQQPVFDTDKEIASIEKATSELRVELERLERRLRDCRHTRASLAAVEKKEKRRLQGEKQRALDDYNSRTEELNTIREMMGAIEKDKLVARLLETYSGEVGVELARTVCSLANIPRLIRLASKKLEALVE